MTNSFKEVTDQLTEIQESLKQAANISKDVPAKINQLIKEKNDLDERAEEMKRINADLKEKTSTLE